MNSTPRRIVQRRSVFRPLIQFPIVWIIAALIAATILAVQEALTRPSHPSQSARR